MDLKYQIVRSAKRKNLTISVERDRSVLVHAPEGALDETIQRLVETKRQWLFGKLNHAQKYQHPHAPGKEVVNGESAAYLGREYRIELATTESGLVEFSGRFLIPPAHQARRRRKVLKDWYFSRAKEVILPRVEYRARDLGVIIQGARIVDNRYRWGSCTMKDRVNLNWRLIKAPMDVIDYVIVHELAHLLEANHTPQFWNIVRANTPNSGKAKAWLKEHGQVLEENI